MSSASSGCRMKLGMFLWFVRRNTFSERAVVDGIFAIAAKSASHPFQSEAGSTKWHPLHQLIARRRPDSTLPREF